MIFLTLVLYPLVLDRWVGRGDGILLTALMVAYLVYVFYRGRRAAAPLLTGYARLVETTHGKVSSGLLVSLGLLGAGTLGLLLGGRAIVESALFLSDRLGISELGIGLTVVAVGTSLPELATSVLAALRKETDIAVGNIIGSNIFNIVGVLGITSLVRPISVDPRILFLELPAVVGLSLLVLLVAYSPRTGRPGAIHRWEGALLLCGYVGLGFWFF